MRGCPARNPVLVLGAAQWDMLGRGNARAGLGDDLPGRVQRRAGGVALNAALALSRLGIPACLVSAVGADSDGRQLVRFLERSGVNITEIIENPAAPTGCYVAVEDCDSVVAAIADCRCLNTAETALLGIAERLLRDHSRLSRIRTVVADGNLTSDFLSELCRLQESAAFHLVFLAASPAKAPSAGVLAGRQSVTLYLNRREAEFIYGQICRDSISAARALLDEGFDRVVVTDGSCAAADGNREEVISAAPIRRNQAGVTGSGDRFAAAHLAASLHGLSRQQCLMAGHRAAHLAENDDPA